MNLSCYFTVQNVNEIQLFSLIVMGIGVAIIVDLLILIMYIFLTLLNIINNYLSMWIIKIGKKKHSLLETYGQASLRIYHRLKTDINRYFTGMKGLLNYAVLILNYPRSLYKGYGLRCSMDRMAP